MSGAPLALSLGDPAGIGPEIILKAWRSLRNSGPPFFVIGDASVLDFAASAGGEPIARIRDSAQAAAAFTEAVPVVDLPLSCEVTPGRSSPAAAAEIIQWIETGAGLALSGEASGLVKAPIAKAPLYEAGFRFPGHTEFIGSLCPRPTSGPRGPVMMLTGGDLRVSLVTIHEPLSRVPGLLTLDAIVNVGRVTAEALRGDFGVSSPRIAVAALNPHAGEGGALGAEEATFIAPAVDALRAWGVEASGPHPADSLFHPEARGRYDAAVCMYHDQALIPVKMLDFWGGVNVTLGLPLVRTSPDHGVGYDIAGKGLARADSLIAALRLASAIATSRRAA